MSVEWTDEEHATVAGYLRRLVRMDTGDTLLDDAAASMAASDLLNELAPIFAKRLRYLWKVEADAAIAWEFVDEHQASIERLAAERDALEGVADSLAYAIAPVEVIGEHSSSNNPWANALEIAKEKP